MRFGIILDGGSPLGRPRQQVLEDILAKARAAYRCGFQSIWVGPGYLNQGWHSSVLLGRVAAEVPGMELGIVGILPLYHPVELAEQLATLDVISGGRLVLGAAMAWREFLLRAFEVPLGERLSRFLEVLQIMKTLWTQEQVTYTGKYFHLDGVPGAGQPLQRPYPKILIAANLDPGVRRAARIADGWLISSRATLPTIARQLALYRKALPEGQGGYAAAWREMYVARDRDHAIGIIRPHVEWLYRDRAALGHNRALPEADRIDVSFDQVLEGRFIIGSPEECATEVRKYRGLGVEELILRCQWPGMAVAEALKAIELFGREVMPRLRA